MPCRTAFRVVTILLLLASSAHAQTVIGTVFHADKPFAEFMPLWQEGWSLKDEKGERLIYAKPDMPLGGYAFIYFKNTGTSPIKVTDLTLDGIKLSEGIGVTETPPLAEQKYGSSILLSKLPKDKTDVLKSAGWPVWWKPEPREIPPGGFGEIVVRMKRAPTPAKLDFGILTDRGTISASVPVKQLQPRFATIAFTPDLKTVYLYARHPKAGSAPTTILLDGRDVTAACEIKSDKSLDLSPIIIRLQKPLDWMTYHSFQARYPDGSSAIAGIRAFGRDMIYGMWGASLHSVSTSEDSAKKYLTDWATHNINCSMGMVSGPGRDYYQSEEGWAWCESIGISRMTTWDTNPKTRPAMFFLQDEPDAHDFGTSALEPTDRLGSLAQWLVGWQECLRKHDPAVPILLNIDNTYKPENWYMYHQLSDVPCIDPYYPEQLDQTYRNNPSAISAHSKPTYVYGVATISQSSCQPKPLHVLLCSTKYYDPNGYEGRFPTPEEIRIQAYYIIAAGAKTISYWWFSPDKFCRGVGDDDPAAFALWKEIGLLGAELRTAGPIITRGCPASLPVSCNPKLWLRTLVSGADTVELIVVNDNFLCDRVGTVVKPTENASVSVTLPSWLAPVDVFEVTTDGVKGIPWKREGSKVSLDLGTVNVGRFVLITSNPALRTDMQKTYETKFAENVHKLKTE